jgi:hypothetical protein
LPKQIHFREVQTLKDKFYGTTPGVRVQTKKAFERCVVLKMSCCNIVLHLTLKQLIHVAQHALQADDLVGEVSSLEIDEFSTT